MHETSYGSPVVPIDLPAEGYVIWPCPECSPWHAEVVTDAVTGAPVVREWHAVGCGFVREALHGGESHDNGAS